MSAESEQKSVGLNDFHSSSPPENKTKVPNPMENLSKSLDEWSALMKNAVLKSSNEHCNEIEILNMKVKELESQLVLRTRAWEDSQNSLDRKENLLDHLLLHKIWGPKKRIARQYFSKWCAKTASSASVSSSKYVFSNHIAREHRRKQLKRKVIKAWVVEIMQKQWKKTIKTKAEKEYQFKLNNMGEDYAQTIAQLQSQVLTLEEELKQAKIVKSNYAEELKQALLRGVCALNLETMTVLSAEESFELHEEHSCNTSAMAQMIEQAAQANIKSDYHVSSTTAEDMQWPSRFTSDNLKQKNIHLFETKKTQPREKTIIPLVNQKISTPLSWVTIKEGHPATTTALKRDSNSKRAQR